MLINSLMRMLGPRGNPTAGNLVAVLQAFQDGTGVRLAVQAVGRRAELRNLDYVIVIL
jgi:hypothetical protein